MKATHVRTQMSLWFIALIFLIMRWLALLYIWPLFRLLSSFAFFNAFAFGVVLVLKNSLKKMLSSSSSNFVHLCLTFIFFLGGASSSSISPIRLALKMCLLGFYAAFNIISVISRRQFTHSWSLGKHTSTRLENVPCPRALHHDRSAAAGDRTRNTWFRNP